MKIIFFFRRRLPEHKRLSSSTYFSCDGTNCNQHEKTQSNERSQKNKANHDKQKFEGGSINYEIVNTLSNTRLI